MSKTIKKIFYFDSETIQNTLEEYNEGSKTYSKSQETDLNTSTSLDVSTSINLGVPFSKRVVFAFTGKLSSKYLYKFTSKKTITSTQLSEFRTVENKYIKFKNVRIKDIENSSTFFRVAGKYVSFLTEGVEGIDVNQYQDTMDSFDGYDTYLIDKNTYIRFNTKAFVSNYKRNELLITKMDLFCIKVGEFDPDDFDFLDQIYKMEKLYKDIDVPKTLSELEKSEKSNLKDIANYELDDNKDINQGDKVVLYDAVLASIHSEAQ